MHEIVGIVLHNDQLVLLSDLVDLYLSLVTEKSACGVGGGGVHVEDLGSKREI